MDYMELLKSCMHWRLSATHHTRDYVPTIKPDSNIMKYLIKQVLGIPAIQQYHIINQGNYAPVVISHPRAIHTELCDPHIAIESCPFQSCKGPLSNPIFTSIHDSWAQASSFPLPKLGHAS